jgi:hypothetical protein
VRSALPAPSRLTSLAERKRLIEQLNHDATIRSLTARADRVRRARESGHSALYGVSDRDSLEFERALLRRVQLIRQGVRAAIDAPQPPIAIGSLTRIVRL